MTVERHYTVECLANRLGFVIDDFRFLNIFSNTSALPVSKVSVCDAQLIARCSDRPLLPRTEAIRVFCHEECGQIYQHGSKLWYLRPGISIMLDRAGKTVTMHYNNDAYDSEWYFAQASRWLASTLAFEKGLIFLPGFALHVANRAVFLAGLPECGVYPCLSLLHSLGAKLFSENAAFDEFSGSVHRHSLGIAGARTDMNSDSEINLKPEFIWVDEANPIPRIDRFMFVNSWFAEESLIEAIAVNKALDYLRALCGKFYMFYTDEQLDAFCGKYATLLENVRPDLFLLGQSIECARRMLKTYLIE